MRAVSGSTTDVFLRHAVVSAGEYYRYRRPFATHLSSQGGSVRDHCVRVELASAWFLSADGSASRLLRRWELESRVARSHGPVRDRIRSFCGGVRRPSASTRGLP
jgi:hypothetical protein